MRQTILLVLKQLKDLGYEGRISVEEYEWRLAEFEKQVAVTKDESELADLLAEWLDSLIALGPVDESRRDRFSW